MIGLVTGSVAYGVHKGTETLHEVKFEIVYEHAEHGEYAAAYFAYLGFNMLYALSGTLLLIFWIPSACGSGIPDVKAYLNGVRVPKAFNVLTAVGKIIGVITAVAASLPCGPEGPMIHIGGLIGGGVGQGSSKTLGVEVSAFKRFRNPRDRRDFISSGAAAGVSAAFGAPIGGILFSIEECASFWSHSLTWRTFFGCMVATFTVNFLLSGADGKFDQRAVILFNVGTSQGYRFPELWPFMIIAAIGGFSGALFVAWNILVNQIRRHKITPFPRYRVVEMIVIVIVCSTVFFCLSFAGTCLKEDVFADGDSRFENSAYGTRKNVRWNCEEHEYNDYASLFLVPQEMIIKHLFSRGTANEFPNAPLVILAFVYFAVSGWVAGSAVAGGIVVPKLVIGAAYGRWIGQLVYGWFPDATIDPGTYALIGASAFFGGVSRMTMSLTIILLEITNDLQFLLPIMMSIIVAKAIADFFTPPLYDMLILLKCLPFLEAEPSFVMEKLRCSDVMSHPVKVLRPVMRVNEMLDLFDACSHSGFPVVNPEGRLLGTILRSHILTIVDQRWYTEESMARLKRADFFEKATTKEKLTAGEIRRRYPDRLQDVMDVRPFMNAAAISVSPDFSVARAFVLFRTMGLRHLTVVDGTNCVVGMITRKDLMEHAVEETYEKRAVKGWNSLRAQSGYAPPSDILESEVDVESSSGDNISLLGTR
jgi:chloride channel 7